MSVLQQLKKRQQTVEAKGAKRSYSNTQLRYTQNDSSSLMLIICSLLFDWKEAARIPAETIRMLALEGLEQLNLLDPRIGKYGPTLFTEASQPRHLLTKGENEQLDQELSSFLSLLSPHFLLGGCHKVLEFLIRKYQYAHRKDTIF